MKKIFSLLLLVSLMALTPCFVSCGDDNPSDTPTAEEPSILGRWSLDKATQLANGNEVDVTNFYGTNFCLTFLEDGTLITSDGINDVPMHWELDGVNLNFIQAPGMPPVAYIVQLLTDTQLTIVNGTGTDYVTTMEFSRI